MESARFFVKDIMSRMGKRRLAAFLTAFFMLLAFMPIAGLAAQPEVGAFTRVEGRVDVLRDKAQAAAAVKAGDVVYLGDIVRTKTGGRAEITFKDQSVLSIAPGSRLRIDQYVLDNDNTRKKAEVSLLRGKIRAAVTKAKDTVIPVSSIEGSTFNINTPTAVAGIRGTDLFVFYSNGVTGVVFTSGQGFVYNVNAPDRVVNVQTGYATFITSEDAPPTRPRPATDIEIKQLMGDTALTLTGGGATDDVFGYQDTDGGLPGDTAPPAPPSGTVAVTDYDPSLLGDITPPVMTLDAAPAYYTNQNSASFVITFNEPATVTYTVNNVVIKSGSTSTQDTLNIAGLPEGSYSLAVTAVDAAGNTSTFSFGWTTDYTPPTLSNAVAPPPLTNSPTTPMGLASSEDPNTFYYYSFDNGVTWVQGSANTTPVMPEGAVTIDIKAVDRAGNVSPTTFTYALTTDYTAPSALALFLNTKPVRTGGLVYNDNWCGICTINATATDVNTVASYTYTLDGVASTGTLTGLTEGLHTFAATATDAAGNTSAPINYSLFNGARQYDMAGGVVDATGASVLSAWGQGRLNLISTGTQGAWQLDLSGPYTGTPSTSVVAAGTAYDSAAVFNGYWIDKIDLAAGTSNLAYLSATVYGTGVGTVIGGYDGLGWFGVADTGLGTYTETPLDLSGNVWGGLLWYDPLIPGLRYANAAQWDTTPNVNGIIGLVGNLWSTGAAQAHLMGTYNTYSGAEPYLIYGSGWYMNYDPTVSGYSTSLGGAFNGYNVGVWANGVTKSNAVAIYIDPSGSAGYLRGVLDGAYYNGVNMWEMNGGLATTFKETTAILPADLAFSLTTGHYGMWGTNMSGGFATTGGLINASYVEGSLKGLVGHNWGIWNGGMGGSYDTLNASTSFTADVGASDFYYDGWWNNYMVGTMTSSDWGAAGNAFTGSLNARFMTPTLLGNMTSDGLYGTFDPSTGIWQSSMVGTWQATPLAWSGNIAYDYNDSGLYNFCEGLCGVGDTYGGLAGGTQSPWPGTTSLTLMGPYYSWYSAPYLWNASIYSYNRNDSTYTTYDGGAFWGVTGGVWKGDGTIDAKVYGLYIDPDGNAGILKGSLAGAYYPDLGMFEADGQWSPTILATGLDPVTLGDLTYNTDLNWWTFGSSGAGSFTAGGSISEWQTEGLKYSIPGQDWGILQAMTGGGYSGTTSDTWNFSFNYLSTNIIGTQTDGAQWSNGVLKGTTYGYGADITAAPMTWISVGETIGTFNDVDLTWQAVQTSAWLETNRFLVMACPDGCSASGTPVTAAQQKLQQLNIPFAEVGRANLSGSGTMGGAPVSVNMNNVTFFAYSSGAAPKIWATGNVNGSYGCSACGAATVAMTGNGLNANFNIKTFDTVTTQKWLATVDGGGTYSGTGTMNGSNIQMNGAAAGTIDTGASTFNGTGSGTAQ